MLNRKGIALCTVACQRCKRRKQKCDGDYSAKLKCSNCKKAGHECHYEPHSSPQYLRSLERKIKTMQTRIQQLESQLQTPAEKQPSPVNHDDPLGHAAEIPLEKDSDEHVYVGRLSGFRIDSMFLRRSPIKQTFLETQDPNIDWTKELVSLLSDPNQILKLINVYLELVHAKYPALHRSYIERLKTMLLRPDSKDPNFEPIRDRFISLMVLAIAGRAISEHECTQKLRKPEDPPEPHAVFFVAALSLDIQLSTVMGSTDLKDIHMLILLVIYLLRTPNSTMIWDMIRFTMGMCIHLGLHRRDIVLFEEDPYHYQQRMRTFWTVYSLERVISNSFGRPYSVSDRDIDVDLPIDADDSLDFDADVLRYLYYRTFPERNYKDFDIGKFEYLNEGKKTSLSMAIHLFRLRIIDSEIQHSIYRVDRPHGTIPLDALNNIQRKMKEWVSSLPRELSTFESDYCLYLFNKQICSLTQLFVTKLDSHDMLFTETIRSCIDICLWSRRVHQNSSYQQSFISLQTAFLSGVTIVYALLSGKIHWSFDVGEGLRNCSSVLYLFAERSKGASKYRDIFEALVFKVDQMRQENNVNSCTNSIRGSDLFGQDLLKRKLQQIHKEENLKMFDEMSKQSLPNGTVVSEILTGNLDLVGPDDLICNIWKFESLQNEGLDF